MPSIPRSLLSDEEIADVLTFVRQSWGNFASPVDASVVEAARGNGPDGGAMWEVSALRARYPLADDFLRAVRNSRTR